MELHSISRMTLVLVHPVHTGVPKLTLLQLQQTSDERSSSGTEDLHCTVVSSSAEKAGFKELTTPCAHERTHAHFICACYAKKVFSIRGSHSSILAAFFCQLVPTPIFRQDFIHSSIVTDF